MTQERVNNNNSYAFVLEDPSKPRKYQLNFNLDTEYVKEPAQMDQSISHHQYNPQHNHQQQQQRQVPSQVTLPSIRELIPIPPPVPQVTPSAHRHPYHHQPYPYQKQQESLMTSSARPHLPPLQPSVMETPSNPPAFNYTQSVFPNQNNMIQSDKSDRGFHERMDQPNLHPSSIQPSLPVADVYSSHQNYPSPHFIANNQHQQPIPPSRNHHYPTNNNNNNNNSNNTTTSQSSSSNHVSHQRLQHQSYQQIQQQQHNQQTQHHHHNHHHNNHQQQQQNLSQTHHYQQKHHHPVITNNSSPSSTVSQSYQSNVYSNEIERSQHDLQSASTVRPPYNAHNRQSYYSQVYPGSSPPPPPPPHSNHSISQQQKQSPVPPPPLPLSIPPQQMISQSTISAPSSDLLSNRNGSSADLSVVHPQPNTDRRFIQRDPINSLHNVHEQQQISPQSQPYKLNVQPPPLSDLLNPPRSISRPVTPPPSQSQSQSQSQAPSQQPPLISRDNRETFPYLAPPPHHQSGSNSSVSTRSSSPVPTTPVANSNSNNNVSYSPHHSPNNNMVPVQIDKPIAEQNASQPKRRGRSQKPRPIVPAGPLPNQQSVISSQVQPQSSATNDTPVFVQYVIPTSNNNGTVDTSSHLPPASKSLYATRPRKNSSVGGGNVSSVPKRPRKQKDNSNVLVNDTHVIGEENKNNKQLSDSLQLPSAVTNNSEGSLSSSFTTMSTNPRASTIPNRKREHPAPSSPRNTSKIKRCKKDENFDDDVMMEDASAIRNVNIKNSSDEAKSSPSHMEAVFILQSLKEGEGSNSPPTEVVTSPSATPDIVGVKGEITKQVSEEPKVDQFENLVATKVRELSLDETDQFKGVDNVTVKSPLILSKDPAKNSVTGEAVKPTLTSNKTKKKGFNGGNNSRNDPTNKVNRTRQMPSVAISDQNAGNDSDNDLAMDDGSDDEEYAKRNQPISNNNVDDSVQWNSDEMETEEEVEEEVVIFENTEVKDEGKSTFVSSPPPLPSLPPSTASHPNLVRTKNENCSDALSTTSSATHITTANSKNSRPASPITSNCGNASSLVSRKGSISSNGSNKDKDVFSDVLDTPLASPSPSTITSNHITNGSGRPQRPCPPRRRSTMRDDEKLELGAIEWEKNIEIPQHIWEETLRVFEIVKHSKEMKNRQPHRKRNHILASILFILCRQNGLPRTFVEICNAASIRKQEIGSYYRLMLKVFESNGLGGGSNGTVDSAEYLKRWCQNLKLPSHILDAAIHVYKQASELNITTGKCPVSVGAASIWLSISSWNEIRSSWNSNEDNEQIKCEHKDVAQAAGVVNATLVGCFKNLSKYKDQLLPAEFLQEAKTRPPYNHKKIDFSEGNPGNNSTVENDCRDDKKTTFFSSTPSLENLKFYGPPLDEDEEVAENDKTKVETIKVENVKVEPTTPTISSLPNKVDSITSPRSKSLQLESKNCKTENSSSNPVKAEPTHSPFKEIKPEKSSVASKNTVPEPQDDADDELEEGELREDCDDAMMD